MVQILNTIADAGIGREDIGRRSFEVPSLGTFVLGDVHESWSEMLLLGAFDFYNSKDIRALHIIPDREHWTIDIPDMSQPWSIERASAWQWLRATLAVSHSREINGRHQPCRTSRAKNYGSSALGKR